MQCRFFNEVKSASLGKDFVGGPGIQKMDGWGGYCTTTSKKLQQLFTELTTTVQEPLYSLHTQADQKKTAWIKVLRQKIANMKGPTEPLTTHLAGAGSIEPYGDSFMAM